MNIMNTKKSKKGEKDWGKKKGGKGETKELGKERYTKRKGEKRKCKYKTLLLRFVDVNLYDSLLLTCIVLL